MKNGKFKIAHNVQEWWGFTLQRGHAFGMYDGVCYVSSGQPDDKLRDHIRVYEQIKPMPGRAVDAYRWRSVPVLADSDLGQIILLTLRNSPYDGLSQRQDHFRANPRWTRVPGGHVEQTTGKPYYLGDPGWKEHFPTFREKRPTTMPRLPRQGVQRTWVDDICKQALSK